LGPSHQVDSRRSARWSSAPYRTRCASRRPPRRSPLLPGTLRPALRAPPSSTSSREVSAPSQVLLFERLEFEITSRTSGSSQEENERGTRDRRKAQSAKPQRCD